jgi:hypothetical protein
MEYHYITRICKQNFINVIYEYNPKQQYICLYVLLFRIDFKLKILWSFRFLHSGPGQPYPIHDTTDWEQLLDNKVDRSALQRKAVINARRFGLDLKDWIDSLNLK